MGAWRLQQAHQWQPQEYPRRLSRGADLVVGLRFEGLVGPGGRKRLVDVVGRVEVEAQGGEVRAKGERGQVRVRHPDDAQQAQQAEAVRLRCPLHGAQLRCRVLGSLRHVPRRSPQTALHAPKRSLRHVRSACSMRHCLYRVVYHFNREACNE